MGVSVGLKMDGGSKCSKRWERENIYINVARNTFAAIHMRLCFLRSAQITDDLLHVEEQRANQNDV